MIGIVIVIVTVIIIIIIFKIIKPHSTKCYFMVSYWQVHFVESEVAASFPLGEMSTSELSILDSKIIDSD